VGKYLGQLLPLSWPWVFVVLIVLVALGVLLSCFMIIIAVFGVMYVAASLFICVLVLPLLSSLLRVLIVLVLPYRFYCYLLSLLLRL